MSRANCLSRRLLLPLVAVLALCAGEARAQEPAPAPTPAPARREAPKIDVTGFVDVYYGYNFNGVDPIARTFDVQHNAFSLSLAEVAFAKGVTPESRVGFRVDLDFGKTADLVAAYEPEGTDGKEIYKHIQQAYGSLLTGKVQWDVGKFVTPMGAEVIESQDNWNYTRSILFGYAIPFYHVGIRTTVPVSDKLSLAGFLTNGWNNSSEMYGDFPCVALQATLKPSGSVTWIANYMVGQEAAGDDADNRQPLRHHSQRDGDLEAQPDGQLRLRQGGRHELVGHRRLRQVAGGSELGPGRALRVRGRHRRRLHDVRHQGPVCDGHERSPRGRGPEAPARVPHRLRGRCHLPEGRRKLQEVADDPHRRGRLQLRREDLGAPRGGGG